MWGVLKKYVPSTLFIRSHVGVLFLEVVNFLEKLSMFKQEISEIDNDPPRIADL